MKKKLLALLLAALMVVSLLPTVAFAANGTSSTILITNGLLPITENNEGAPTGRYIAPDNAWENENGAKAFIGYNGSKHMLVFRLGEEAYDSLQISEAKSLFPQEDGYHLLWTDDESSFGYNAIFDIKDDFTVLESIKVSGLSKEKLNGTYTAPVKDDCTYTQKVTTPENSKTYGMKLNCKDKGEFTFEANGTGWNIKEAKDGGKYLNAENGKLVLGNTASTAWTYKNGAFSTTVKTTQKNNGYWLGFLYIPGRGTKTVTTTYYLSTVADNTKLSTYYVGAELFEEVSGSHEYGKAFYVDKTNHKYICKNCGDVKTEAHSYDETTHKCVCGAFDPAKTDVKISVDVKEKTTKKYVGWGWYGSWKDVTTYTATIKTEATGVKVCKVEYQLNDSGKWIPGAVVCSDKPIDKLNVRVWDSNGNKYEWPEEETPVTYTVKFDLNGATDTPPEEQTIASGGTVYKPEDPTFANHTFAGWYKTKDGTTGVLSDPWNFDTDTVKADMTLYAQWTRTIESIVNTHEGMMGTLNSPQYGGWLTSSDNDAVVMLCNKTSGWEDTYTSLVIYEGTTWWNGIPLTATATKANDKYVYSSTEYGTWNFTMTDGKLSAIEIASVGTALTAFSSYTGTYTAPMRVKELLDTVSSGFPNSSDGSVPEGVWVGETNQNNCYVYGGSLYFEIAGKNTAHTIDVRQTVTESGTNWTVIDSRTYTFNMTNGVLTSITVAGATGEWAGLNDTYAPASN